MKKHTKQIISGVTLFILGGMVIPTIFIVVLFVGLFNDKPLAKFTIPGQSFVTIEESGRYYLWNDYQTIFEGQTYSNPEDFPGGLKISLRKEINGTAVEFVSSQSITSSNGDSHKKSIGYFEIEEPGQYILNVFGETEPRVCSFGKSFFNINGVLICLTVGLLEMLMGITGFVLVLTGIINLIKARKCEKQDAGSSLA